MVLCSLRPTCSKFWSQSLGRVAYQQTWTTLHQVLSVWPDFLGLSIHVINYFHSVWGRNVYCDWTSSALRAAAALVRISRIVACTAAYTFSAAVHLFYAQLHGCITQQRLNCTTRLQVLSATP